MLAETTPSRRLLRLTPRVYEDGRGFFFEAWKQSRFQALTDLSPHFVQDNHSRSNRGMIRGLHYQMDPSAQGKLVERVVSDLGSRA